MENAHPQRRGFNGLEKAIVAGQALVGVGVGLIGFIDASDPGWQDLQRLVILMMLAVWIGGIAGAVVLARLVENRVLRVAVLLAVPFAGFVILVVWSTLGA